VRYLPPATTQYKNKRGGKIMAVFKPTNCSPYLTAFDMLNLDNGVYYFSCKIDTSNTKVGGYSITIYDNDNN
jgi:hypothetical protein